MRRLRLPGRALRILPFVSFAWVLLLAVSLSAAPISVVVPLTGNQEEPEPVFTGAFGTALLTFDPDTDLLHVDAQVFGIDVEDLMCVSGMGPFHLHVEDPSPPTDQVGPVAVQFGFEDDWIQRIGGITLSSTGTNVGAFSDSEIESALNAGTTYLNLHTNAYPSGEIRGDVPGLVPPVPEPGTLGLLGLGLSGLMLQARRGRRV